ncbi:hypothetical protein NEOLI_000711 [Neolecta irregularis DAH-3]|uniref:F-box domain-containing protein n=1 Tax=Neolecta irregularis (strain DAH-3) TaxID=1198029 RepID=A0A1U7LW49_NEOID|nr:hypothetical protein NEOLI_000711 [Neolecta irregularis DAH-3]|eukprot:OLL26905.1 hypothetical protein NEOLI_000711 [Neolecta irregularis DAH-3]
MSDIAFPLPPVFVALSRSSTRRTNRSVARPLPQSIRSSGPPIYSLPGSILVRIFSFLVLNHAILSTLLVNSKFHDLSIPQLYKHVRLRLDAKTLQFFITIERYLSGLRNLFDEFRYPDRTVHIVSICQNITALQYWASPEAFTSKSLPDECVDNPYIEVITKLCAELIPKCLNLRSFSFADFSSAAPTIQTIKSLSTRPKLKSITVAGLFSSSRRKSELACFRKLGRLSGLSDVTILGGSKSQADLEVIGKSCNKFLKSQKQLTSLGIKYLNLSSNLIFNTPPWKSLAILRLQYMRLEAATFDQFIRFTPSLRLLTAFEVMLDSDSGRQSDGIFSMLARVKIWKKPMHLSFEYSPEDNLNLEKLCVSDPLSEAQFLELGRILSSYKIAELAVLDMLDGTTMTHKIARMISNLSNLQHLTLFCNLELMGKNPEAFAEIFSKLMLLEAVDMGSRFQYSDQSIFKLARIYGTRIGNLEGISIGAKRATIFRDDESGEITEIKIDKPTIFNDMEKETPQLRYDLLRNIRLSPSLDDLDALEKQLFM